MIFIKPPVDGHAKRIETEVAKLVVTDHWR
jgi:hypothetical protein